MMLSILPDSATPAYRQLYEQIAGQILSGQIPPGTALPAIRAVAKELGVSVITVRGAWDALEADGLIETRTGSGCFAAALPESERSRRRENALSEQIAPMIAAAKQLGYTEQEFLSSVQKAWRN